MDASKLSYRNPIDSPAIGSIRDCQILVCDGRYYLTGTCSPYWQGPNPGVRLYSSDDLLDWQFERLLLARGATDPRAWYRDRFWAPELHAWEGRFYLTFNCRNDKTHFPHSCGLAVADEVLGPYTVLTHDAPLVREANDLTLFADDNGDTYIFFEQGAVAGRQTGIMGHRIDLRTCQLLGEPFLCFSKAPEGWEKSGIEGPWVIKRQGSYFMFYSAWSRGYEVGFATAPHPTGPWTKYVGNPFFGAQDEGKCARYGLAYTGKPDDPYVGVGHNATFVGPDGRDWIVAHYQERGGVESLGFDPMWIEDGVIRTLGPTHTEQVVQLQ